MNVNNLLYRLKPGRKPPAPGSGLASDAEAAGDGTAATRAPELIAGGEASSKKPLNYIIAGRREFTDQFSHLARGKRNWQIAAFISLGLLCVVTLAYIELASSSRITPYIVEVDELGQARAFGPAEQVEPADQRLITSQLGLFIRNIRTVYQDPLAERDMIVRAYAFVDQSAQEWLNGYFQNPENDPRVLMRRISRRVEVKSIIAVPESDSWKVTWIEIETPHGTDVQKRTAWEGYLTLKRVPPTSTATIEYNPLGLYITAINWTQVSRN